VEPFVRQVDPSSVLMADDAAQPVLRSRKDQDATYQALFNDLAQTGLEFIPNSEVADLLKRCKHLSTGDIRSLKFKAQRFFKNSMKTSTNRGLGIETFPLLMKTIACAQHPNKKWGETVAAIDMSKLNKMKLPLAEIEDLDIQSFFEEATGSITPSKTRAALHKIAANSERNSGGHAKDAGVTQTLDITTMDRNPFQSVRTAELEVFRSLFRVLAHVIMVPPPVANKFDLPRTLAVVGARSVAHLLRTTGVHALSLRSIFTSTMAVFGCTGEWMQWPVFVTLLRMVSLAQQLAKESGAFSRRQFTPIDVLESMPARLHPPTFQCEVEDLHPVEESPELDVAKAMEMLSQSNDEKEAASPPRDDAGSDSDTESSGELEAAEGWALYDEVQDPSATQDPEPSPPRVQDHAKHMSEEESSLYVSLFNDCASKGNSSFTGYEVVSAGDVAAILRSARLVTPSQLRLLFGTVAAGFESDGREFTFDMFVAAMRLTVRPVTQLCFDVRI